MYLVGNIICILLNFSNVFKTPKIKPKLLVYIEYKLNSQNSRYVFFKNILHFVIENNFH